MDVLNILQRQHGHGPRSRQSQVGADDSGLAVGHASWVLAVRQERPVVVPENNLRRIRSLQRQCHHNQS